MRFIDRIWQIRGSLALAPGQSADDAFERLAPLFQQRGDTHERLGDTLKFRKKDQAAQDKLSVIDWGVLQIERGASGAVLRYHLASRALLFCFLLPVLFVAIGQFTIAVGNLQKPSHEAASKSAKKPDEKAELPQNWIDKALGAPAPEKPKKDKPKSDEEDDDKPSPTSAYVFAGIFAVLYVVGRFLEDRLIRNLLRTKLLDNPTTPFSAA
jgi:hypothetical protein